MTFLCPHCGRIIDGHILTDTEMIDHEMALEGVQAKLDYAKGQLANIGRMTSDLRDYVDKWVAKLEDEAEGD
jgi:hypothetical protein